MSDEHELALRRRQECGRCNKAGTKFCDSASTCVCWSGYGGAYCQRCTSEYSFISANGTCLPCPCNLQRSTGACILDPTADDRVVCVRCVAGFAGLRCDRSDNSTALSTANPNGRINAPASATPIIAGVLSGAAVLLLLLLVVLLLVLYLRRRGRRPLRRDPAPRVQVNPNDVFFSIADYAELSPPERKRELPAAARRNSAQFYFLSPNGGDEDKLMDDSDDEQTTGASLTQLR